MRYFDYIEKEHSDKIFYKKPEEFNKNSNKDILKYALGAFLYIPATQYNMIYKTILDNRKMSRPLAICLEDAIGATGEEYAIETLELVLENIKNKVNLNDIPLIFIRIKNPKQLNKIKDIIYKNKNIITGILIPKADGQIIEECINCLDSISLNDLYVLPIVETKEFIYKEIKDEKFLELYKVLLKYKDRILNIRIGLTDILGIYGVRRSKEFSIYENIICSNFINDIITYLSREELNIPISGGVSEFYNTENHIIKNEFIREIMLDKFHGLVGKTVIHPNQVKIVQIFCIVTYEDYMDAKMILDSLDSKCGVSRSSSGERMNEFNPHLSWARKTIILAKIYGVLNKGVDYDELLKI